MGAPLSSALIANVITMFKASLVKLYIGDKSPPYGNDADINQVATVIANLNHLEELALMSLTIPERNFQLLLTNVFNNSIFETFTIGKNAFNALYAVLIITKALKGKHRLQYLKLDNCHLSHDALFLIAVAMAGNNCLQELIISDNNITPQTFDAFTRVILNNPNSALTSVTITPLDEGGKEKPNPERQNALNLVLLDREN